MARRVGFKGLTLTLLLLTLLPGQQIRDSGSPGPLGPTIDGKLGLGRVGVAGVRTFFIGPTPIRIYPSDQALVRFVTEELSPNFEQLDPTLQLKVLMDFISQTIPVTEESPSSPMPPLAANPYEIANRAAQAGLSCVCGGTAVAAVRFLRLFGFRSVRLELLETPGRGHTLNAVYLPDHKKFAIVDFYVNYMFFGRSSRSPLSFAEIRGKSLDDVYVYNGSRLKLRRLEADGVRLEPFTAPWWSFPTVYEAWLGDKNWLFDKVDLDLSYWQIYFPDDFIARDRELLERDTLLRAP